MIIQDSEDIGADELKMQAFFNKVEETFNIKLFDSEKRQFVKLLESKSTS